MKPLTIIGGGLAGLTLGIGLRRKGVPVTIWEAATYPRHRVCGEFISGRGQKVLQELGLRDELTEAGAVPARTALFFLGLAQSPVRPLPEAALCLSRFELDALLARRFRAHSGELREGERWREGNAAEGIVLASGRRPQTGEGGWRWFGLKVHARNVPSIADLEMHGSKDGYVGITRLREGEVNVCGLFRRRAADWGARPSSVAAALNAERGGIISLPSCRAGVAASEDGRAPLKAELLRGAPGTPLRARLAAAVFDESSFCSVAGLSLRPQRAEDRAECCIGDALTMIPPVTGNGMSMAFESAQIAVEPVAAYCRGELTWTEARLTVARACDGAFGKRLRWAGWLQGMMFAPACQRGLERAVLGSKLVWRVMFAQTR